MKINELKTPVFLVDLDLLEKNINYYQKLANSKNKNLVPMTKTHKSTDIAKIQFNNGINGFVVGTLDEAIKLANIGIKEITIPYPLIGLKDLEIIESLLEKVNIIISVDSYESMKIYNDYFNLKSKTIEFLLIINTGLNRFGISPDRAGEMIGFSIQNFQNLKFRGISTHPGQVYSVNNYDEVKEVAKNVHTRMLMAYNSLINNGIYPDIVATGSTPTFIEDLNYELYNVLRPGNYVFFDNVQMALGVVKEENCALTVMATIISNPSSNKYIIDCGSKSLGLDKGAHGSANIKGYGYIIGHDELVIKSLSEEVAIVESISESSLKIGDKLRIIPNHSCSVANMTSFLVGVRNDKVEKLIEIDIRGNSSRPLI